MSERHPSTGLGIKARISEMLKGGQHLCTQTPHVAVNTDKIRADVLTDSSELEEELDELYNDYCTDEYNLEMLLWVQGGPQNWKSDTTKRIQASK
jgi:hypothetical protein